MGNIKETKEKILDALEDKDEERLMGFRIEIVGNSGNCSISQTEEFLIQDEIEKVLRSKGIDDFEIKMFC